LLLALSFLAAVGFSHAARIVPAKAPLYFEPNQGQAPASVRYVLRDGAAEALLEEKGLSLVLPKPGNGFSTLRIEFAGANRRPGMSALDRLSGHSNYLIGSEASHWLRNLPNYARVRYGGIYPGIDVVFYGNGDHLEHDFEVAPGADPSKIRLDFKGAAGARVMRSGDLRIGLGGGALLLKKPVVYQEVDGTRKAVAARFFVGESGAIGFRLGRYDRTRELVIDPVLEFSTYLSSRTSVPTAVTTDAAGNTYITGYTYAPFPTTPGAFQSSCSSSCMYPATYVTKLNAAGTAQIYSTMLGSTDPNNGGSQSVSIAVDASGDAIVGGTGAIPVKNPIEPVRGNGIQGGYIASLAPDGSSLNFASSLGDGPIYVTTDKDGNVYFTGTEIADFPATAGALDNNSNGFISDPRTYICKLTSAGKLIFNAVVGDNEAFVMGDGGYIGPGGIASGPDGSIYIAETAGARWPTTPNAYKASLTATTGSQDVPNTVAVARISADGTRLEASTFVGTGEAKDIAVDAQGNAWVVGTPDDPSYPVTPNGYNTDSKGGSDFFSEVSADGTQLLYSSYAPSLLVVSADTGEYETNSQIEGIVLDSSGDVWLTGTTDDPGFPMASPLISSGESGYFTQQSGFVTEFDPAGKNILFSTLFGGTVVAAGFDPQGKLHIAGISGEGVYVTPGSFLTSVQLDQAANPEQSFAALIDPSVAAPAVCTNMGAVAEAGAYPVMQTDPLQLTNCGKAPLTFQSFTTSEPAFSIVTNTCTGTLAVDDSCALTMAFAADGSSCNGALIIQSNASVPTILGLTLGPMVGSCNPEDQGPNISRSSLDFGSQAVSSTSASQTITLTNPDPTPIYLDSIVISSAEFAETNTCGTTVQALGSCTMSVTFTPAADGPRNAQLAINYGLFPALSSEGKIKNTRIVSLNGTGTGPAPGMSLSAPYLAFAASGDPAQDLTLTNSGSGPVSISSIATSDSSFAQTNNCPPILGTGKTCSVAVTFNSPGGNPEQGLLTITDNAVDSPQVVSLLGAVSAVAISASPSTVALARSGAQANVGITFTSINGGAEDAPLTCNVTWVGPGTASLYPTCSLSPSDVNITSHGGSATLTISTQGIVVSEVRLGGLKVAFAGLICLILVPRRHRRRATTLVILLAMMVGGVSACGGGASVNSGGGTGGGSTTASVTPGNYVVTVTSTLVLSPISTMNAFINGQTEVNVKVQ
jgi:hypothetical protein